MTKYGIAFPIIIIVLVIFPCCIVILTLYQKTEIDYYEYRYIYSLAQVDTRTKLILPAYLDDDIITRQEYHEIIVRYDKHRFNELKRDLKDLIEK